MTAAAQLILGDCLAVMRTMPAASVDAVVTDPPYGLRFMGAKWDATVPDVEIWREVLRVLKPGGYLLSFFGTRTYHRGVVQIEDAGFEIRDCLMWIFGSGFPKSLNVSKAIDRAAGAEREVVGPNKYAGRRKNPSGPTYGDCTYGDYGIRPENEIAPTTPAARQWDGFGTALKPAFEPIVLARAPCSEPTVAANVLKHGTGALNVKGCVIGVEDTRVSHLKVGSKIGAHVFFGTSAGVKETGSAAGRWPANLVHDGSPEVVALFPNTGISGDSGSAARFFYCAKSSRAERDKGCAFLPLRPNQKMNEGGIKAQRDAMAEEKIGCGLDATDGSKTLVDRFIPSYAANNHPTVKPLSLLCWLLRLVTPPGGTVLDPFMGSGSTLCAAAIEGMNAIGIEQDEKYVAIARARADWWAKNPKALDDIPDDPTAAPTLFEEGGE